jgi:hypothetical protein
MLAILMDLYVTFLQESQKHIEAVYFQTLYSEVELQGSIVQEEVIREQSSGKNGLTQKCQVTSPDVSRRSPGVYV